MDGSEKDRAKMLAGLARPTLALIESCELSLESEVRTELMNALLETPGLLPLQLGLLRAACIRRRPDPLRALGLKRIHDHCARAIATRVRAPARGGDDWSIEVPLQCTCTLCARFKRFLETANQRRLEWPLAQAQRAHLHHTIDIHGLPVTHTTRRSGRPFTLLLEKTNALFERRAAARRIAEEDLRWLEATVGRF